MYFGSLLIFVVAVQLKTFSRRVCGRRRPVAENSELRAESARIQTFLGIPTSERVRNRFTRTAFTPTKALEL